MFKLFGLSVAVLLPATVGYCVEQEFNPEGGNVEQAYGLEEDNFDIVYSEILEKYGVIPAQSRMLKPDALLGESLDDNHFDKLFVDDTGEISLLQVELEGEGFEFSQISDLSRTSEFDIYPGLLQTYKGNSIAITTNDDVSSSCNTPVGCTDTKISVIWGNSLAHIEFTVDVNAYRYTSSTKASMSNYTVITNTYSSFTGSKEYIGIPNSNETDTEFAYANACWESESAYGVQLVAKAGMIALIDVSKAVHVQEILPPFFALESVGANCNNLTGIKSEYRENYFHAW